MGGRRECRNDMMDRSQLNTDRKEPGELMPPRVLWSASVPKKTSEGKVCVGISDVFEIVANVCEVSGRIPTSENNVIGHFLPRCKGGGSDMERIS